MRWKSDNTNYWQANRPAYIPFVYPVHNFKNIYNIFQTRKRFELPPVIGILSKGCVVNFNNIAELQEFESTMVLRKAHKLSPTAIHPKAFKKRLQNYSMQCLTKQLYKHYNSMLHMMLNSWSQSGTKLHYSSRQLTNHGTSWTWSSNGKHMRDITPNPDSFRHKTGK